MHFSLPSLLSYLTLTSFLGFHQHLVSGQVCEYNATVGLRISVDDTRVAMLSDFDSNCGSNCMTTEGMTSTVQNRTYTNFDNLNSPIDFYEQYTTTCIQAGMSICTVSNVMRISVPANAALGAPAGEILLTETDKPVCFPISCREDQQAELNVYDKQCLIAQAPGSTGSCEVISSEATCPENKVTSDSNGSCRRDNPRPFNSIQLNKQALYALMDAQCADASSELGTNTFRFCSSETEPATVITTNSYTELIESPRESFTAFHEDCANSGGSVCGVSFNFKYAPFSDTIAIIDFELEYTDYPVCVPKPCAGDVPLVEEHILEDFASTGIGVSFCDGGSCDLEVKNINCFPDPSEEEEEEEETVPPVTEEETTETTNDTEEMEDTDSEMEIEEEEAKDEMEEAKEEMSSAHYPSMPIANLVAAATFVAFVL